MRLLGSFMTNCFVGFLLAWMVCQLDVLVWDLNFMQCGPGKTLACSCWKWAPAR